MPPPTEKEIALERRIVDDLRTLTARLHQRSLDNAVLLAQQAARGRGSLVEHFAELGRRFGSTLAAPETKPRLRVIDGGQG